MPNLPVIPTVPELLLPVWQVIAEGFRLYWPYIMPAALFFTVRDLWLFYIRMRFIEGISWITLEVLVPKDVEKTPKAMEQVFAGLAAIASGANFIEKWRDGKVQEWISFEMAGEEGKLRFFIRTPEKFKNMVMALIFSQYAQADIKEVDDYTENSPKEMPSKDFDLWGTELIFDKDNAYPIRTYPEFEEAQEEKRIDPLASFAEVMNHLGADEKIWVQFLLRPAPKDWKEKGDALVNKLIGKKEPPKPKGMFEYFFAYIEWLITGFVKTALNMEVGEGPEGASGKEKEGPETKIQTLSPGEKSIVEAIEKKLSKVGFEAVIRIVYWGRRDIFSKSNIGAILSYFRQFNTLNMNAFKPNKNVTPSIDYWFKNRREFSRKVKIWYAYKKRLFLSKPIILNTEELATIYHFPTIFVEAPTVYRVESRKGGPPPTLPVENI